MPLLLAVFPLLGKLIHKLLLRPIFNKYVRKALSAVFKPVWKYVGQPVWQRTGAPVWQKIWHEAPQKTKVKKQFDTVSHCPSCDEFAVTRVERYGENRVLLKVVPGPAVGPRQLRAVCDSCAHERPVRFTISARAGAGPGRSESPGLAAVAEPAAAAEAQPGSARPASA